MKYSTALEIVLSSVNILLLTTFLIAGWMKFTPIAFASNNYLDANYGAQGVVNTSIKNGDLYSIYQQQDGKILIGGYKNNLTYANAVVARYTTNGSLDTSFGDNGIFSMDFGIGTTGSIGVASLPTNKIIVAGEGDTSNGSWGHSLITFRLNPNGTIDNTYGENGLRTTTFKNFGFQDVNAHDLLIQKDQKIVITGELSDGYSGNGIQFLVRYNSNGTLDNSFGDNGIKINHICGWYDHTVSIAQQLDGKLLVSGDCWVTSNSSNLILTRYNEDGTVDSSFGNNGTVIESENGKRFEGGNVLVQNDGKIIVTGSFDDGSNFKETSLVIRYHSNGDRDTSFANNGLFESNFYSSESKLNYSYIQPDQKILLGGYEHNGIRRIPVLTRINSNGSLDLTFGDNGLIVSNLGLEESILKIFQFNNKIIAGIANPGITNWKIATYNIIKNIQLDIPYFSQKDDKWGSDIYDSAKTWSPTNPNIKSWGCALTSAAMIFKYHGINKLPDGKDLDPGTLNSWLKSQNDGYLGEGHVNWFALPRLSKLAKSINNTGFDALQYSRISSSNSALLTNDINNSIPEILEEPRHFIVAKGIDGNTFTINDPYYNNRKTLNDGYLNAFLSMRKFVPSHTDLSYIVITSDPDTTINLTNKNGNRIGEGYIEQPLVNDQKNSQSNDSLQIYNYITPDSESYNLEISSIKHNNFTFKIYLYDVNGNVKIINSREHLINKNNTYTIYYDKINLNNVSVKRKINSEELKDELKYFCDKEEIEKTQTLNSLINKLNNNDISAFFNVLIIKKGKCVSQQTYNSIIGNLNEENID